MGQSHGGAIESETNSGDMYEVYYTHSCIFLFVFFFLRIEERRIFIVNEYILLVYIPINQLRIIES